MSAWKIVIHDIVHVSRSDMIKLSSNLSSNATAEKGCTKGNSTN